MPNDSLIADGNVTFSAADWCYVGKSPGAAEYYRRLAGAGYGAAEMVDPPRRAMARAAGLRLLNFPVKGNLNRTADHRQTLHNIRENLTLAQREGIEQLIVFSGDRQAQDSAVGIANCIAALKDIAGEAERAGITLTLEVFNTYDHPDYDADNGDYAFSVVRAVSSPAVRVLYDLYHMHRMREDVAAKVTGNLEYIAHLHVAGSPRRDFPGAEQDLDYAAAVRAIHQAGYRGAWGMEFLPKQGGDPIEELSLAARQFRNYFA